MKRKIIPYVFAVVSAALCALLCRAGAVGIGFAAAVSVGCALTLNITGRTAPSAVCTAMCLVFPFIYLNNYHVGVSLFALGAALLSFFAVFYTSRHDYGLILSDALGALVFYVPFYLCVRYISAYFISSQDKYEELCALAHYPLMTGVIGGAVIAFFTVPAVRVFDNRASVKGGD